MKQRGIRETDTGTVGTFEKARAWREVIIRLHAIPDSQLLILTRPRFVLMSDPPTYSARGITCVFCAMHAESSPRDIRKVGNSATGFFLRSHRE